MQNRSIFPYHLFYIWFAHSGLTLGRLFTCKLNRFDWSSDVSNSAFLLRFSRSRSLPYRHMIGNAGCNIEVRIRVEEGNEPWDERDFKRWKIPEAGRLLA